jgi:hypothetical protein
MQQNNIYLGYTLPELEDMKLFMEKQFADATTEVEKWEIFAKIRLVKAAIKRLS